LDLPTQTIKETLNRLESMLSRDCSQLTKDQESAAYFGFNFHFDNQRFKFRKAKVTPKKTGLFVALWKRDNEGQTTPFTADDHFDYYLISVEQEQHSGLFVFPKQALIENRILTMGCQVGKRGFRVYPDWSIPTNKQATKSKQWQHTYFVDFMGSYEEAQKKLNHILQIS